MSHRVETDSMGSMHIPENMLYGASTQRAVENFPISGIRFPRNFIRALGWIKWSCAQANISLELLDPHLGDAILQAISEIAEGKYDEHFVLDIFQTGSGTSTNMNFNEVAANIANLSLGSEIGSKSPIHPNDHINLGQSSNDIFPSTIHVAAALQVHEQLLPTLNQLHQDFQKKVAEFATVIKIGRTHLQDATPLTLGQEFSGYACQIKKSIHRIEDALHGVYELAVGGTAVGTGINSHIDFGKNVAAILCKKFNIPFSEAENHFEAQATKDACVQLSGSLKTLAVSLTKIGNDIRWLSSGPRCGIGEITVPEVQPGSSIMPGKVNPVIIESLLQVCTQVIGNDVTISIAGSSGNFELNTMMPLISRNLLESIQLLNNAISLFSEKCILGIKPNYIEIQGNLDKSLMLVTALVPSIGYDKAAEIARKAFEENKNILEVATKMLSIPAAELEKLLNTKNMMC
ncbi:MAG: class II fumarate hydratase [Pseudomonadota bacterium]